MNLNFLTAFQFLILLGSFSSMMLLFILWKRTAHSLAKAVFNVYTVFFLVLLGLFSGNWVLQMILQSRNISFEDFSFSAYPQMFKSVFPFFLILPLFTSSYLLPVILNLFSGLLPGRIPKWVNKVSWIVALSLVLISIGFSAWGSILDYTNKTNSLFQFLDNLLEILFVLLIYGSLGITGLYTAFHLKEIQTEVIKKTVRLFLVLVAIFLPLIILDQLYFSFGTGTDIGKKIHHFLPFGLQAHWLFFFTLSILCHIKVIRFLLHPVKAERAAPFDEIVHKIKNSNVLSPRELEVISLTVTGISNKEIAEQLSISHATVKNHLTNAYRKLNVSSRWDLLRKDNFQ